ncbi:MAG TPA: hypothetical protein VMD91_10605 [Candidatus Sulfotelmatobacter sp.]|nr:hypothetical protein [Candidatus Sulfotelmatobacter sp.]
MHDADRQVDRTDDRSSTGVLWRAPSPLRNRIRNSAKALDISQNTYLTTTAIFGELMIKRGPEGMPENVRTLFVHMNEAVQRGERMVMDACHEDDWSTLQDVLSVLQDARLLRDVADRKPTGVDASVVVYGFSFTREGVVVWKRVGPLLTMLLDAVVLMKKPQLSNSLATI